MRSPGPALRASVIHMAFEIQPRKLQSILEIVRMADAETALEARIALITPQACALTQADRESLSLSDRERGGADGSPKRQDSGAAIGLAVGKQIIEVHGGRILLDGEPGRGAAFRVLLPTAG